MGRLKHWIATFGTNIFIVLAGIITGALSARILLPEGRGELAAVLLWPQLIAGLGFLSLREAITHHTANSDNEKYAPVTNGIAAATTLASISCVLGFWLVPHLLGNEHSNLTDLTRFYLLVFVPFNFIALALLAVDHGQQSFALYNLQRLLPPAVYLISLVILWGTNNITLTNLVYASPIGTVMVALIRLSTLANKSLSAIDFRELGLLFKTGIRFHGITILLTLGAQADQIIAVSNMSNREIGFYMIGLTLATSGVALIANSTYDVMFPALSTHKNPADQARLIGRGLRLTTIALILASLFLCINSFWLIPFLFGPSFNEAIFPTQLLLLAYIPVALRQMTVRAMRAIGQTGPAATAEALGLVIFAGIGWILARELGPAGLSSAVMLAGILSYAYLLRYLHRRLELSYSKMIGLDLATIKEILDFGRLGLRNRAEFL